MVTAKTQKQRKIKISLHSKFTISVLMIFSQNVIFAAMSCPDVHLLAIACVLSLSFMTLVMA